jgi:hypothetical protein
MKLMRKAVSALGTICIAALLIAALAPKTTHGIATLLVQITNTTANPVPSFDVSKSAAQNVWLICFDGNPFFAVIGPCQAVIPSGIATETYVVPAGQNLVITDIDVQTPGGGGTIPFGFIPSTTCPSCAGYYPTTQWSVPNDAANHQIHYESGLVFPAGTSMLPVTTSRSTFPFTLHGYLTPQ